MTQVGIRALKQNASAVVAEVAAGQSIVITDRGRPVAQMTPLSDSVVERWIRAGFARPALRNIWELPAPEPGPSLSDEVERMRAEERY